MQRKSSNAPALDSQVAEISQELSVNLKQTSFLYIYVSMFTVLTLTWPFLLLVAPLHFHLPKEKNIYSM